jgi:hypothetical protein
MEAAATIEVPRRDWLSDLWRIGFIMLLALTTRSWIVAHTEVLSRDGIGFIRYAMQLENPPTALDNPNRQMTRAEVLQASSHPPGYSLSILVVSWPVRAAMGGATCDAMTFSAQLASILASLLLVLPMYFLGKLAFDRQTAFIGTMLFQVLPVTSHVASDGLSDNLFLFLTMLSTWLAALGLYRNSWRWFGPAGLTTGFTYLVRPEGLIVVIATGLVVFRSKLRGEIRWRDLFGRGSVLLAGLLLVMAPYVVTIGRLTNKPTGERFIEWLLGDDWKPSWTSTAPPEASRGVDVLMAKWFSGVGPGDQPDAYWAGKALGEEFLKASFYGLPFFAAIGLSVLWPRVRGNAAALLIVVLGTCHSLLLWRVAKGAGYVAERHTLLIVLCSCYFSAASFPVLGEQLARLPGFRSWASAKWWSVILAVLVIGTSVPAAMRTLHGSRGGHRAAGLWIATQERPGDYVLDPFAWGEFYSGHLRLPATITTKPETVYILFEKSPNMHPRLHAIHLAKYFADRGRIVYHWPEQVPVDQGKVFVYRWDGDDFYDVWFQAHHEFQQKQACP